MLARIHHEGRRKMAEKTKLEEELGPQNDTERLVWAATYGAAFTALLARSPYTMVQAAAKRELINTAATNAVVAAREAILALRRGPVDP